MTKLTQIKSTDKGSLLFNESSSENFKSNLNTLIKYTIKSFSLDHVIYKGKKYYNQSNLWSNDREDDLACGSYEECELTKKRPRTQSKIEYVMQSHGEDDYDSDDDTVFLETLREKRSLDLVVFPPNMTVVLVNESGFNNDHRGSDHTLIHLDFNESFVLKGNTLRDLAEGLYRIKSHKFDLWYELYVGCTPEFGFNLLTIIIAFDHGS